MDSSKRRRPKSRSEGEGNDRSFAGRAAACPARQAKAMGSLAVEFRPAPPSSFPSTFSAPGLFGWVTGFGGCGATMKDTSDPLLYGSSSPAAVVVRRGSFSRTSVRSSLGGLDGEVADHDSCFRGRSACLASARRPPGAEPRR